MCLKSQTYKLQLCSSFCNKCPVITGKQCTRTQLATTQRPDWVGRTKTKYTDWQFYFMERALLTIPIFYKRCTYINLQNVYPYWKERQSEGCNSHPADSNSHPADSFTFCPGRCNSHPADSFRFYTEECRSSSKQFQVLSREMWQSSSLQLFVGFAPRDCYNHPADSFRFCAEGCNSHRANSFRFWAQGCNSHPAYSCRFCAEGRNSHPANSFRFWAEGCNSHPADSFRFCAEVCNSHPTENVRFCPVGGLVTELTSCFILEILHSVDPEREYQGNQHQIPCER